MKIYFASGYSVMNNEGRERELFYKFGIWRRLISFYDVERGNNIFQVLILKRGIDKNENLSCDMVGG